MPEPVTVIKLNTSRRETWRYSGTVMERSADAVLVEAYFNREDMLVHGILFGKNDRFVEIYYADRWYNINEIHDRDTDAIKGWYCNVSLPAEFEGGEIRYVDLALDLLVFPNGKQLVLDEDEFAALEVDQLTKKRALRALDELRTMFPLPGGHL